MKNLPRDLKEPAQAVYYQRNDQSFSRQSIEEIMKIVGEARKLPPLPKTIKEYGWAGAHEEDGEDLEHIDEYNNREDEYDEMVKVVSRVGECRIC